MRKIKKIYRGLLMAVFALWFGGFTFYTAFVVPTGTEVLGSSRAQGFITQQVTSQMNLIGGFAIVFFVIEILVEFKHRSTTKNVAIGIVVALIALLWGGLLWIHPMLDEMIDVASEMISDEGKFYQLHRGYLWTSTVQWVLCWIWLFMTVADWTKPQRG